MQRAERREAALGRPPVALAEGPREVVDAPPQAEEHPVGVAERGVPRVARQQRGGDEGDSPADEAVDAPRPGAAARQR